MLRQRGRLLQQKGIGVVTCGICLSYFELKEQVAVREISNTYTIADTPLGAGNVVAS